MTLPYDEAYQVQARLADVAPHFANVGAVEPSAVAGVGLRALAQAGAALPANRVAHSSPFQLPVHDYYLTDAIARASQTMAKCSAAFSHGKRDEARQASA